MIWPDLPAATTLHAHMPRAPLTGDRKGDHYFLPLEQSLQHPYTQFNRTWKGFVIRNTITIDIDQPMALEVFRDCTGFEPDLLVFNPKKGMGGHATLVLPSPVFVPLDAKPTRERWDGGCDDWIRVPGLRADEMRRVVKARARGDVCPLASAGVTKPMILEWWKSQPFDLEIPDLLGNCGGCFLKNTGKLLWIAHYYPETLEPMAELEAEYGDTFRRDRPSYRRLLEMGQAMSDARADALIAPSTQEALPMGFSCSLDDELPCNCTD